MTTSLAIDVQPRQNSVLVNDAAEGGGCRALDEGSREVSLHEKNG
jgi:hypothetical protein